MLTRLHLTGSDILSDKHGRIEEARARQRIGARSMFLLSWSLCWLCVCARGAEKPWVACVRACVQEESCRVGTCHRMCDCSASGSPRSRVLPSLLVIPVYLCLLLALPYCACEDGHLTKTARYHTRR